MTRDEILSERSKIVAEHGPWTAHDIELGHGVSTRDEGLAQKWRVDFFNDQIRKHSPNLDYADARILDLACLEGLFAIEFARMGASTVGLEIREAHLAKARFVQKVHGLARCQFVKGDVRDIPKELGRFDVIICAGILYHLDFPDCVHFLKDIAARATDLVIVDSCFAYEDVSLHTVHKVSEMRTFEADGRKYRGRIYVEHAEGTSEADKAGNLWASFDNNVSTWLDERDAVSIMDEAGFAIAARHPNLELPYRPTLVFKRKVG
jgi:hypothetical protein